MEKVDTGLGSGDLRPNFIPTGDVLNCSRLQSQYCGNSKNRVFEKGNFSSFLIETCQDPYVWRAPNLFNN